MTSKLGELRSLLPGGQPKEPTVWDEISESTSMSKKTRLRVFAVLFVLSTILSFTAGFGVLRSVVHPKRAVVSMSMAGMLSLLSTTVLWGVKAQAKSMFATKRWILTSSYLAVMFISLFLAFKYGTEIHPGIYFTLICLQEFLYVSYCLSFVPYGRKIGWRVMTKAIDSCCGF